MADIAFLECTRCGEKLSPERPQTVYTRARECYNRAISRHTDYPDPFYHRAICSMEAGDTAAIPELKQVVPQDAKHGSTAPRVCWHRATSNQTV